MQKLQDFLTTKKPLRILDIGTGTGQWIYVLHSLYQDYEEVIGIDLSEKAIEIAKKQCEGEAKIHFEVMDATNLSYPDHSFDLVCISNSLHHLPEIEKTISEMKRVLKQGGSLLFAEMQSDDLNARQVSHKLFHHFSAKIDRESGISHKDTFTKQEILNLISESCKLEIDRFWHLESGQPAENTKEEIDQLLGILDRQTGRIANPEKKLAFVEEAEQIKNYVRANGFDSAPELIVIAH